jgi:chromosome segregation ATPase
VAATKAVDVEHQRLYDALYHDLEQLEAGIWERQTTLSQEHAAIEAHLARIEAAIQKLSQRLGSN